MLKANAEDHASGQKLAQQYGIDGYPCALLFLSYDGKLIGKISGYKDAADYQSSFNQYYCRSLSPGSIECIIVYMVCIACAATATFMNK